MLIERQFSVRETQQMFCKYITSVVAEDIGRVQKNCSTKLEKENLGLCIGSKEQLEMGQFNLSLTRKGLTNK